MAEETGIAWAGDEVWAGQTWNAWQGCREVGCDNMAIADAVRRLLRDREEARRQGAEVPELAPPVGADPATVHHWETATKSACLWCYARMSQEPKVMGRRRKTVELPDRLWGKNGVREGTNAWDMPGKWDRRAAREKRRIRVFVGSICDVFETHPTIDETWRHRVFQTIEACRNLDFLLLTKRPGSIRKYVPEEWLKVWPSNCWLGTTVEHEHWIKRIDHLLAVPGGVPVRFLSCEPLLGPLDLRPYLGADRINWVLSGGESGFGARWTEWDWFRQIRDACIEKRVAFFYKQPGDRRADRADWRPVVDPLKPVKPGKLPPTPKTRDQWLLDGKAWWQWPELSNGIAHGKEDGSPRKRGRPTNVSKGLSPRLDDKARQARRRAKERHDREGGWAELVARWLDPLPRKVREEAAKAIQQAIAEALEKP